MARWVRQERGFTIVELLIVIVIIAILAAITIVSYSGIQKRAQATAAMSDLRQFSKIMEQQQIDTGKYPTTLTASMGIKLTKDVYGEDDQNRNARYCYDAVTNQYILFVGTKSKQYFYVSNTEGLKESSYAHGYSICSKIGLSSVNPSHDGLYYGSWAAWTN